MELWDLYNKDGNKINKSHSRGDPLNNGEFHMVVENWIKNNEGQYLIQKRTKPLRSYINPWSTTAGAAVVGETSILAIQRETQEEIGLIFNKYEIIFIERSFFDDFFMDVYETVWNGKIEDIIFDPKEVSEIKWVTKAKIQELYKSKEFYSHGTSYLQRILDHSFV